MALGSMQKAIWGMFGQQLAKLPPEAKEAMSKMEVNIIKEDGMIRIVSNSEDPSVCRVRDALFGQLMTALPQIIGAFQCKVRVFK